MWVNPPDARCNTPWERETENEVLRTADGVPSHVLDIRSVSLSSDEVVVDEVPLEEPVRRLQREQRRLGS